MCIRDSDMSVEIGFAEKRHLICTTLDGLARIQDAEDAGIE